MKQKRPYSTMNQQITQQEREFQKNMKLSSSIQSLE